MVLQVYVLITSFVHRDCVWGAVVSSCGTALSDVDIAMAVPLESQIQANMVIGSTPRFRSGRTT